MGTECHRSEKSFGFSKIMKLRSNSLILIAVALHASAPAQTAKTNHTVNGRAYVMSTNVSPKSSQTVHVVLTGVADFPPRKWAFITARAGTQEMQITLREGEEKAGIRLHSVDSEAAQARVTMNGTEQTISFGAPLPGISRERFNKEERDREHARISAWRAQQDRERDGLELSRRLNQLEAQREPITPKPEEEFDDQQ